jgi:hypothetical protein
MSAGGVASSTQQKLELKLCLAPAKVAESQTKRNPRRLRRLSPVAHLPENAVARTPSAKKRIIAVAVCCGHVALLRSRDPSYIHAGSDTL